MKPPRYLLAVVVMAGLGVAGIVLILLVKPVDPVVPLTLLLGSLAPTTIALLTLMQGRETHVLFNSRMDQLLRSEKATSRAEGVIEGEAGRGKPTGDSP